jgi:hypothetical protein
MIGVTATLATGFAVLADSSILESAGRALSAGPERTETLLFASAAGILILIILLLARVFAREPGEDGGPRNDYLTDAVDLLGLSESDRRDLQRIAKLADLAQPAAMLLSPMNLARAAAATPEIRNDRELRRRIERLCLSVFDAPLPDPGKLHRRPI